jgi:transcriptional regulator with XRE-family HTH domain
MNEVYNHEDMRRLLNIKLAEHGSLKEMAAKLHLSAAYLSDMRNGNRALTPRVLKELGYERKEIFIPISQ